jgi:chloramphenicol-sensitive protein RarD
MNPPSPRQSVFLALAAYAIWGGFPFYFSLLEAVPAWETLLHRIVWAALSCILLLAFYRRTGDIWRVLSNRKLTGHLAISGLLIATNWVTFIWAVTHGQVLESSMGYFICPLAQVMLGAFWLKERLSTRQKIAAALAAAGVAAPVLLLGTIPWVALILAFSFSLYGLARKLAPVDAVLGLTVETLLLAPAAVMVLIWGYLQGEASFGNISGTTDFLLLLAGPLTALPLIFFAHAAKGLRLSTLGFLQYSNPSFQFVIAILFFHEPASAERLFAFALIWAGLAIYSYDLLKGHRLAVEA